MENISLKEVSENFESRFSLNPVCKDYKEKVMDSIRDLADKDESFENLVFELGCEMLAEYYVKVGVA